MHPSNPGPDGLVIGVAFSVKHDGEIRVDGVMPDSPAHKARRPPMVGDQLLRVNGQMIPALISKQELALLLSDQCWKSSTLALGFRSDSWKEYTSVIQVQPRGSPRLSRSLLSVLEEEKADTSRDRDGFPRLAHNLAPPVPLARAPALPAHNAGTPNGMHATRLTENRSSTGSQPRQGRPSDSSPHVLHLRPGTTASPQATTPGRLGSQGSDGSAPWENGQGSSPLHGGSFDPQSIQDAWGGWQPGSSDKKQALVRDVANPTTISWNGQSCWDGQSPNHGHSPWVNGWRLGSPEFRKEGMQSWGSASSSRSESRRDLRLGTSPSPPPSGDRSSRSTGSDRLPSSLRVLVDEMKEEVMAVRTMAEEKIMAAERGRAALQDELAALQDEAFERVQGMQDQLSSLKAENLSLRLQVSRLNEHIHQQDGHRGAAPPPPPEASSPDPPPLRPQQRSQPIYPPHFLSQSSFNTLAEPPPSSRLPSSDKTWRGAAASLSASARAAPTQPPTEPTQHAAAWPLLSASPDPMDGGGGPPMFGSAQAQSDGSEESRTSGEARLGLFAVTMEDGHELRIDPSTGRVVGEAAEDDEGLELL